MNREHEEYRVLEGPLKLERLQPACHHEWRVPLPHTSNPVVRVHVLMGARPRPCLALIAGVHGDEYDGIFALQDVVRCVPANTLAGSLVVVPVANPFAFVAATRCTPADGQDLNRVFPGRPHGTVTERLAFLLVDYVLAVADLVFALHGARATDALLPWLEFLDIPGSVGERSYAAAQASGFVNLVGLPPLPGRLMSAMASRDVPLIEGEIGGRGEVVAAHIAAYRTSVDRVARHLGIRDDRAKEALPEPQVWHLREIRAPATGVFASTVTLGDHVSQNATLGRVLDEAGEVLATICAPCRGTIAGMRVHAGVTRGDGVFSLFTAAMHRTDRTIPAIPGRERGEAACG